jgi:fatty-acyl-CoA synthase
VKDRLQELVPETLVLNNFGSTETGHQGSAFPGSETGADGRPSFAMSDGSLVLDDELRPLAPGCGVTGRLARTGHIPLGYYKDAAKTAERFVTVAGVRYVLPGDLATVEDDGRITVYGRGSNCINTGGEKVFPEEVEEALKTFPGVVDSVVVGLPDEKFGEAITAVVEPQPGEKIEADELIAHVKGRLASFKAPKSVVTIDTIGRAANGKVDYKRMKAYAADELGIAP